MKHRVFITGLGVVSPLGLDCASSFATALLGESVIDYAPEEIRKLLPHCLAAVLPPGFEALTQKNESGLDRAVQMAMVALREAWLDANLEASPAHDKERFGVYCGIGLGGAMTQDQLYRKFFEQMQLVNRDPTVMHPLSIPRIMPNAAAAHASITYGLRGTSQTYSAACASSAMALGEAYRTIAHGYADRIVVIGTEAMINTGSFVAWNALRVMAKPHAQNVAASCRPFSTDRCGFVIGEGAACLILESEKAVSERGAKTYAQLCGYGTSSDATHLTAPSVEGQTLAMRMALEDAQQAGVSLSDITYINAHGTATEKGDIVETQSIRKAFGSAADALLVSSTKSMHGHLIGAAGALEFALSIMAMQRGAVPPTAYLEQADVQCDLNYVPMHAKHQLKISAVMSNSFAFGGSNASLIARAT